MKIGLPELHVEMSPVSSYVCRTLSPRGCYKCYCLDKKFIRLHILHSTNLALQCLRTNCEFVGDGTDLSRDLYRAHIPFAL